jgi:aminoglycoside 6-adenylyltransferase
MGMVNKAEIARSYEIVIKKFVEWAEPQFDIRAAVIIGSRARRNKPADEWADLDMIVITTNPEHYVSTADWVKNMGRPLLTFVEQTAGGDENERRVLYEGMLDVDFAFFTLEKVKRIQQEKLSSQMAAQLASAFERGMRVLLDKDKMLTDLQKLIPSPTKTSPEMPTQDEFLEVVNDFLYHTIWTAKHLLRGELWWADTCCNCRLSQLMLRMMEWHAKAKHGWKYDTWFRGRFLELWTDQQVLEELKTTFTHYDKRDTGKTLMAALGLFCRMATV